MVSWLTTPDDRPRRRQPGGTLIGGTPDRARHRVTMTGVESLPLPQRLAAEACRDGWQSWVSGLPVVVRTVEERWSLRVGRPFQPGGSTAWVAPATATDGGDVVVKVLWPHFEADHEADALRLWDGNGAVRLLAAEELPGATTLLLERCRPGSNLSDRPEPEQDTVIAGLLHRLWVPPPPGHVFRELQAMCDTWANEFEEKGRPGGGDLDAGLIREGITLLRLLPFGCEVGVVLATDLHAGNVLVSERDPWLAIDPKPFVGDPAYDVIQHLLNCRGRLHTDPRGLVERVAGLAGLDSERVLLWLFARCVQESHQWPDLVEVAREVAPV
jgi:streptomycin 6-kinase